jgi:hypothetical protein
MFFENVLHLNYSRLIGPQGSHSSGFEENQLLEYNTM